MEPPSLGNYEPRRSRDPNLWLQNYPGISGSFANSPNYSCKIPESWELNELLIPLLVDSEVRTKVWPGGGPGLPSKDRLSALSPLYLSPHSLEKSLSLFSVWLCSVSLAFFIVACVWGRRQSVFCFSHSSGPKRPLNKSVKVDPGSTREAGLPQLAPRAHLWAKRYITKTCHVHIYPPTRWHSFSIYCGPTMFKTLQCVWEKGFTEIWIPFEIILPSSHPRRDLIEPTVKTENKAGKKRAAIRGLSYVQ